MLCSVAARQGWGSAPCVEVLRPPLVASVLAFMLWAQAAALTTAARAQRAAPWLMRFRTLEGIGLVAFQRLDGHEFLLFTFRLFLIFVRGVAALASAH